MVRLVRGVDGTDNVIYHPHIPRRRSHILKSKHAVGETTKSQFQSSGKYLTLLTSSLVLLQLVVFLQVHYHHIALQQVVSLVQQQQQQQQHDIGTRTSILSSVNHDTPPLKKKPISTTDTATTNSIKKQQPVLNIIDTKKYPVVNNGDSIYQNNEWNGSPVVIEEYKLIFFSTPKIGCTVWLQLLRRMMHFSDWNTIGTEYDKLLPWDPEINGLKYLNDYNLTYVNDIMTNPKWVRAIFIRDPKERFVSAYVDKVLRNENYLEKKCCPTTGDCVEPSRRSIANFAKVAKQCNNSHWKPQTSQMSNQQWSYINFVGHIDTILSDSERLLKKFGVWERYGTSGWGTTGKDRIFQSKVGDIGRAHATNAKQYLRSYVTKELEKELNQYYANDYSNSIMNLTKVKLY
jgi:hypothetical protein